MELRFITPTDALYPEELELRYRVLREPLGHSRSDVLFPFEHQSLHLIALEEARSVVGCVLFHAEGPTSGRLFQMAVAATRRRHGLGRELVRALEAELFNRGIREVHLHAREPVVPFYERLGYAAFGEPFIEVSILHRHMRRVLDG
jgi:ribosomal protein S18 acetylase RimI-like enzyme